MKGISRDLWKLHGIVVILGFTAILGRLISISAIELVWYRMLLAAFGLGLWFVIKGISLKVPMCQALYFLLTGLVVALHWLAFFGAIKVANISIALACLASSALFTSLIEPLILKRRIYVYEVVLGILTIVGLSLIFEVERSYTVGIILGIIAAFLSALFQVLNMSYQRKYNPLIISFYELLGGFVGISIFLIPYGYRYPLHLNLSLEDLFWLLILAWVCTSYAFAASVEVMKTLSAYNVVLTINLEPIYGIVLARLLFGESELMTGGFYVGTSLMLLAVFIYPTIKRKLAQKNMAML